MADTNNDSGMSSNILVRGLQSVTGPWTKHNLFSWFGIIFLVLFIKGCLIDQYTIPSGSMEPTLIGNPGFFRGDRVLVKKWEFGPRIPFTTKRLWRWGEPERWDIVVFHAVAEDAAHPILIKRVVGLPGEKVSIREGKLWINDEAVVPPDSLADVLHYTNETTVSELEVKRQFLMLAKTNKPLPTLDSFNLNVQTLYSQMERKNPELRNRNLDRLSDEEVASLCADVQPAAFGLIEGLYMVLSPKMKYGVIDTPEYSTIPDDHYFLLGDNSEHSADGRYFGWVPHDHLYGRAFAVWWPFSHRKDFTGFSHTWWGMCLLYGIPGVLIGLEAYFTLRRKSQV